MKTLLISAALLSAFSTNTFAMAKVSKYLTTCEKHSVWMDGETKEFKTNSSKFKIESQEFQSEDGSELTEIYKYLESYSDGEPVGSEDSGVYHEVSTKLNETDSKVVAEDKFESVSEGEEEGKKEVEKYNSATETIWRTISKDEETGKHISLRISHKENGVESKEQILRTRYTDIVTGDLVVHKATVNPQDVTRNGDQMISSSRTCTHRKAK